MFIQVKLLKGFSAPLLYECPIDWDKEQLQGAIIKVPIRAKIELAIVETVLNKLETKPSFAIKKAISIEQFPNDPGYSTFINELARLYQIDAIHFIKRIRQFVSEKSNDEIPPILAEDHNFTENTLTQEQQIAFDSIGEKISASEFYPALLHGVTGSGKTEIYKKLIIKTIAQNKTALLLLPEVTLALQFEKLLKNTLPEYIQIFGFHSGTTPSNKKELWNCTLQKKPILIIGVHLPVILPIPNLGIILVDEEHDVGYQEKKHPKINTKDAALLKASIAKIPILLGSATPSISSLHNVKKRNWNFFQLAQRFAGAFPTIELAYLNDKKQRRNFWISTKLEHAITNTLRKKEQIIIFLNRRGFSFFVQCKSCSFIFKCLNCSVSLTLHKNNILYCHYCASSCNYPTECLQCKHNEFLNKGIGTEQVVTILEKMFPEAKIARADLDTTVKKKKWEKILEEFKTGEINILVGTQTITKGYHFPKVTLVGILWADLNLHFPIFNATETTLQQLIQVAGRAGRQTNQSTVIVQTMSEHNVFQYINEIDYIKFFNDEIEKREESVYPPCIRLIEIEFKYINEEIVHNEAIKFVNTLMENNIYNLRILGPCKPPVEKIKNHFMRKIYIKAQNINNVIELYSSIDTSKYRSNIFFTPNPIN